MAEFDPRQLDQLEDALESLEDIDDLESLELSPALTERLAEYRDVLALCREAFPLEEPHPELLAEAIAEAHALSPRAAPGGLAGGRRRRWWTRWRGVLVPGLALAGTAAAVLLLLEPEREQAAELLSEQQHERSDEATRASDSTPSEPANLTRSEAKDEPTPASEDAGEQASVAPIEPAEVPGSAAAMPSKPPKSRARKQAQPIADPKPAPAALNKDDTWTTLERANEDRRKGDCDRARSRYETIIAASSDSLAIARAKAGIGLCLEQERRAAEAEQWFEQARSASVAIDAWINNQRAEQPLPGESKKAKSKLLSAED